MVAGTGERLPAAGGFCEFGAGGAYPRRLAAAPGGAGWRGGGCFAASGRRRTLPAVRGDALGAAGCDQDGCDYAGAGGLQGDDGGRPAAEQSVAFCHVQQASACCQLTPTQCFEFEDRPACFRGGLAGIHLRPRRAFISSDSLVSLTIARHSRIGLGHGWPLRGIRSLCIRTRQEFVPCNDLSISN